MNQNLAGFRVREGVGSGTGSHCGGMACVVQAISPPRGLQLARGCTGNSGLAFPFVCCLAQFAGAHTANRANYERSARVCVCVFVYVCALLNLPLRRQKHNHKQGSGLLVGNNNSPPGPPATKTGTAKVEKIQTTRRRKPPSREGTTSQPAPFGVGVKAPAP